MTQHGDFETFRHPEDYNLNNISVETDDNAFDPGWYWWSCFPGCVPDSDPVGPFKTEQEARQDAES